MRSGLPYAGRAVHALQSEREAERAHGDPSLRRPGQTADAWDMSRGLSAEELAVQRLDSGDYSPELNIFFIIIQIKYTVCIQSKHSIIQTPDIIWYCLLVGAGHYGSFMWVRITQSHNRTRLLTVKHPYSHHPYCCFVYIPWTTRLHIPLVHITIY